MGLKVKKDRKQQQIGDEKKEAKEINVMSRKIRRTYIFS